jgi:hypothetical protein
VSLQKADHKAKAKSVKIKCWLLLHRYLKLDAGSGVRVVAELENHLATPIATPSIDHSS